VELPGPPTRCLLLQASAAPKTAAPAADGQQKKLWGGRFTGKTDPLMEKFNESLPFDKRMWAEDIRVGMP
jgi:argininosuccinate lyase